MKRFHIRPVSPSTYRADVADDGAWVKFSVANAEIRRLREALALIKDHAEAFICDSSNDDPCYYIYKRATEALNSEEVSSER